MRVMRRFCLVMGLGVALGVAAQAPLPSIECDKSKPECAKPEEKQQDQRPKSTADKFPFPGDESQGRSQQSTSTDVPSSSSTPQSTRDKFPFPTEDSQKAPLPQDDAPAQQPQGSSSQEPDFSQPSAGTTNDPGMSSSSSSDAGEAPAPTTQSDDSPVKAAPLPNYGTRESKDIRKTRERNEINRVGDDLKVAKFYTNDGNYAGAYLRYKDAVEHDAEQADAHFGWATSAEKLGKVDEAREHYETYLKLEPDGDHTKEAERALDHLNKQSNKNQGKK